MAPSIFAEKDFARLFSDIHGYDHIFLDRLREWNWYTLVYNNFDYEAYYCPELVKLFYAHIDQASIDFDNHQVHLPTWDIIVTIDMLEDYIQVPSNPHHSDPLPLIEYMTTMGARCIE